MTTSPETGGPNAFGKDLDKGKNLDQGKGVGREGGRV